MLKFCMALKVAGENVCPFVGVFHAKHLNKLSINIKMSTGISKNFVGVKAAPRSLQEAPFPRSRVPA